MRPSWTRSLVFAMASISGAGAFAQAPNRDPGFPATLNDSKTPFLRLIAPADPQIPSFVVSVLIADPSGIASVSISMEGVVVATRIRSPFVFSLEAPALPVEVCALAVDHAGNSATECSLVGVQGTCLSNDDCPDPHSYCRYAYGVCGRHGRCVTLRDLGCADDPAGPVCGCDGKTYDSCVAACRKVNIAHRGRCRPGE